VILSIAALICLLSFSALLSASEVALFSLSSIKARAMRSDIDPRRRLIAEILRSPRDLLFTIIMLNVSMNILIQNVVSSLFGGYSGWLLNVGVPLTLTLIFSEAIPKSVGLAQNTAVATRVAPLIWRIQRIIGPFSKVLVSITSSLSRVVFFFLRREQEISVDELQHALRTSRMSGVLADEEADLMRGYLNLENNTAKEFMRPREEVLFFEIDEPLSKLVHLFVDQECTRIPICDGGLDKVIGIMTSGNFFLHREKIKEGEDILAVLKKPFFVPEATAAHALLEQMYDKKESLAIVVDEYGSFSGLITLEDLVEVVVGEIIDRRDEKSRYTRSGEDVLIASGKLELMELEQIFDVTLESENHMVTVGGWLTERWGDIPKSGTKIEYGNLFFHVLSSDARRVRRVYIRRTRPKR